MLIFAHETLYQQRERSCGKTQKGKQKEGKREKRRKVEETLENVSESETSETRIAQPQIASFTERMYKHTVEFLGKSGYPMNGLFVCQPLKQCRKQHMRQLQRWQNVVEKRASEYSKMHQFQMFPLGFIAQQATQILSLGVISLNVSLDLYSII